jgi:NitT/TauT family transport system substrate-binding protein
MAGIGVRRARMLCLAGLTILAMYGAPAHARAAKPAPQAVTISMGYVPNVQFAPYYVAQARGYYAAAGLKVSFNYAQSTDVVSLVGSGNIAFGNAEPDQVIEGAAHGVPVVSVFTQYQRFPVVVFALASSDIHGFADLRGKTIGIPALYGASYIGLLAALDAARLSVRDVHLAVIGYAQVAAIAARRVDAAVGYAMNEPVQLRQQGVKVVVLPIASQVPLSGPGVIAGRQEVTRNPDLVRRFVRATLQGQRDTNANPSLALKLSRPFMPGMTDAQARDQLEVLKVAVGYWTPAPGGNLGCARAASWQAMNSILLRYHQISGSMNVSSVFTNQFLGGC